jgi:hypothetical protein
MTVAHTRSRWVVKPLVVVVGGLFLAALLHYAFEPKNGIRVENLKADFLLKLKVGSFKKDVQGWFASHQIATNDIVDPQNLKAIGLDGTLSNDSFIEAASIEIECYFDSNDRLQSWSIERIVDFW